MYSVFQDFLNVLSRRFAGKIPKRWIVERTIAWLNPCRQLAMDSENFNRNALAFLKLASIRLMLRKSCIP
jgi:transposase